MNHSTRLPVGLARVLLGVLLTGAILAACGDDTDDDAAADPTTTTSTTEAPDTEAPDTDEADATTTTVAEAPDQGRIVALAEEFLLADLLSLGITPVASSATVPAAGFQGIDADAVEGMEVLAMTELNLEAIAALEPDKIVTLQFWVDQVGEELLSGIGEVVVVPDNLDADEQLTVLGELFEREAEAAALISELEAAQLSADEAISDECVVSLATIYGGPSVAAYVEPAWPLPTAIVDAGCTLDPDTSDADPDSNGRAWLSLEQLGLLDAPTLVLFQTSSVEGEDEAIEVVESQPLWPTLPAVASDQIIVFDRLGYPGAAGQIRFLGELEAALG